METTRYKLTLLLLTIVLSSSATATDVYRWKDAEGVVHYGQQKPPDAPAQRVTLTHDSETSAEAKAKLDRLMDEAGLSPKALAKGEQQQSAARNDAAAAKAAEVERKRECVSAADNLAKLENWAKHLLVTDSSGTPTTMNSDQRNAAIARIRGWMSENKCR